MRIVQGGIFMLANLLRCPWSFGGWLGGAVMRLGSDISEVLGGGSVYFGVGRHVGKRAIGRRNDEVWGHYLLRVLRGCVLIPRPTLENLPLTIPG